MTGDGLPHKGDTEEARVRQTLAEAKGDILASFPGAGDARVVERDGQVWSGETNDVVIEEADDFLIEVTIADESFCPQLPTSYHGVPLDFVVADR